MEDFIQDQSVDLPEKAVEQVMLRQNIDKALGVLTEKERMIIRLRFGLVEDGRSRTLEEVGVYYGENRPEYSNILNSRSTPMRRKMSMA